MPFHVDQYSENISRALELVFVARGVPPLGYKTYFLVADPQSEPPANAVTVTLDRENDLKEPRRPLGSDVLENEFLRVTVDKATGRQNVSLGINIGNVAIDFVPGRLQEGTNEDHTLYVRRGDTWKKTNIQTHVIHVLYSECTEEIRALKIWKHSWP